MSDKDPKAAKEAIVRNDINRTLAAGGKKQTTTDTQHTKEVNKKLDK